MTDCMVVVVGRFQLDTVQLISELWDTSVNPQTSHERKRISWGKGDLITLPIVWGKEDLITLPIVWGKG